MYDIAAKFPSKEAAGMVYTALENSLRELSLYAHVTRISLEDIYYVNLIYDKEESDIPPQSMQVIQSLLSQGEICKLPRATIETIQQRRAERRAQGIGRYESHEPTKTSYRTPLLRDAETKETIQEFPELTQITGEEAYTGGPIEESKVYPARLEDLPPELRAQVTQARERKERADARPFFIRYREHVEQIYKAEGESGFDPSLEIYIQALYITVPYLFAPSAIRLFQRVLDLDKTDFPTPDSDVWVEFTTPLPSPWGEVKALLIAQANRRAAIERVVRKKPGLKGLDQVDGFNDTSLYRIMVLDEKMQSLTNENYDTELAQWIDTATHKESVSAYTALWASWVRTLLLIIDREYATSPEPSPWAVQDMPYEEEGIERVGKGKNTRYLKKVYKRAVEYKLVSFDVSQAARPEPAQTARPESQEKRANWLTLTSKDEIIYQRRKIAPYPRHYSKQEGIYTVSEHEKYVPMLREKPTTIIKKVIASNPE